MPWIKVPAAIIAFSGEAQVLTPDALPNALPNAVVAKLSRGMKDAEKSKRDLAVIAVKLMGQFVTYGCRLRLMTMRDPAQPRGRVAVG